MAYVLEMLSMVSSFVLCNGIYDVLCAWAIVFGKPLFLSDIHISMFHNKEILANCLTMKHMMAYWILTYGIVRICGSFGGVESKSMCILSYIIEAGCFEFELLHRKNMSAWRVHFVSVSSLFMCWLIILDSGLSIVFKQ